MSDRQLTPHFNLSEFRCKCCAQVLEVQALELAQRLEPVRADFGPIVITSGYRCPHENERVSGRPGSQHLYGLAADIAVGNDSDRFALVSALLTHGFKRLGIAAGHVHADIGTPTNPVIWTYYA